MKWIGCVAVGFFCLAGASPAVWVHEGVPRSLVAPARQDDPEAVRKGVVDPYVEVRAGQGVGSGTALKVGGEVLVLTAGHVVEGEAKVTLWRELPGGGEMEQGAEVVRLSKPEEDGGVDLALLRPEKPEALVPAALAAPLTPLYVGEDAWYCGSGGRIPANLNRTILNRLGYVFKDKGAPQTRFMLVNGNGYFGHSGSGVFVRRGGSFVLVGVVLRIRGDYPKTPVMCREAADVLKFVGEYLEGEE